MTQDALISREEVLAGMPAKQAGALVFAIESRTAYLVQQSRQAMATFLTDATLRARNEAFLQAIAQGAKLPIQPSVQDLERFAPQWATLVPENPRLQAAVIQRLSQKYRLVYQAVPDLRAALGVEQPAVAQAFQTRYATPIEQAFATHMPLVERLRWAWNRVAVALESLPPFWTAFALTLTETVGAGVLALPIALAGVGLIAALVIVIVLGLINVLTVGAIAEAIGRNGPVRYASSYFSGMVNDYLGPIGSAMFSAALLFLLVLTLVVFYLGFGLTLADATGLPSGVWAGGLFLLCLYFVGRDSLHSSVASALVIGTVNIALIVCMAGLALTHANPAYFAYINLPWRTDGTFDVSILEPILGIVLLAYFGHTSSAGYARTVLRRDGTARSLILGAMTATVAAIGLYGLWIVAVMSAVDPTVLAGQSGTVIAPLAVQVGSGVQLLGTLFVVLSMGLSSTQMALSLFYLVRELLRAHIKAFQGTWGKRVYAVLPALPLALIVVLVQWLLFTGNQSFTGPLGFAGMITATVVGGIFPMLILVASRRKGEYVPALVFRLLGNPLVVAALYGLFLSSLLIPALVIWPTPEQRLVGLFVAALIIGATGIMVRGGRFKPRLVVELREDQHRRASIAVTEAGRHVPASVQLRYAQHEQQIEGTVGSIPQFAALEDLHLELPATKATELKVWTHRVTPQGESAALPSALRLYTNNTEHETVISSAVGQVIVPLANQLSGMTLTFYPQERFDPADDALLTQNVHLENQNSVPTPL